MNRISWTRCVTWLLLVVLLPASALMLWASAPLQQQKTPPSSKAVTLKTPDFLKVPADLPGKDFVVAKTAPRVDVAFFAGLDPTPKGTTWSSWGDGCVASNGKYYTSVGDHRGIDANSYIYEYNPVTKTLRRVVDVLQAIAHMLGLYGHGKIHSGIHEAADGKLYFATYWGKHREILDAFKKKYKGSILLRYDPKTGKTENLGAIAPFKGLPTSAFDPRRQMLYFYAVSKKNVKDPYTTHLTAYDIKTGKVKFSGGTDRIAGNRAFLVGLEGNVYFSTNTGKLGYYSPGTNTMGNTPAMLPKSTNKRKGDTLRAGASVSKDGTLFGMTAAGRMFAYHPKSDTLRDLGPNFLGGDYTAAMVLSPDEKYLYFAPGAHGSGNRTGTPVVQYNIATGQRKVLAFLREPLKQRFKYNIGGTYNLQIDPKGERLFITFNGAPYTDRRPRTFGQPCVVVLHIPQAER